MSDISILDLQDLQAPDGEQGGALNPSQLSVLLCDGQGLQVRDAERR